MRALVLLGVVLLGGCSVTSPVAVLGDHGQVLTGSATASIFGSDYQVSNGALTCSGTFDGVTPASTVSFSVHCSDGRQGFGTAQRETTRSGHGVITLEDGETARFFFGSAAAGFTPRVGNESH